MFGEPERRTPQRSMTNTLTASRSRRCAVSSRPETLVSLLRERAFKEPESTVYELLNDAGEVTRSLTTGELDLHARKVGASLQARGAQGSRAILLLPPGAAFVAAYFGCLYAGVVAVPLLPPRDAATRERFRWILRDSGARYLFAAAADGEQFGNLDCAAELTVLSPLGGSDSGAEDWAPPLLDASALAHLQYTAGADGSPRGVMLNHRNLLHNSEIVRRALNITPDDRVLSWMPPHQQMGLVTGLLQPLHARCTGVIVDPAARPEKPLRWLQAISSHRITVAGAPDSAYDLCVRCTTPVERCDLRLECLRIAMNGSPAIHPRTLAEFSQTFAPYGFDPIGFFPFYAAPEATLLVSGGGRPTAPVIGAFDREELERGHARLVPARSGRLIVSRGQARPGQMVRVVDPMSGRGRAAGEVGEIWVGGPSVSSGYWRRRAESTELFGAFMRDTGEGPFMRTGDLGFFLGGELFVSGRMGRRDEVHAPDATPPEPEAAFIADAPRFGR